MSRAFIFFTRTLWDEPPRIRHQLANLLRQHDHSVTFMERPHHPPGGIHRREEHGIRFFRYPELLNHQLHLSPIIADCNNRFVQRQLDRLRPELAPDAIVNFNYDYAFLRHVFPGMPLVTLINDDFATQGIIRSPRSIDRAMRATCEASDVVLTVSYPLLEKLAPWNNNTHIFFPWAEQPYRAPRPDQSRDVALYWGYINHKMDWAMVEALANAGIRLRFVGPVENKAKPHVEKLAAHPQVAFAPPRPLADLDLDDVYCLITPYRADLKTVQAITVPNKFFNVLSRGIPMVSVNYGKTLEAPTSVLRTCTTVGEYEDALAFFRTDFDSVQPDIEAFLADHTGAVRYRQLMDRLDVDVHPPNAASGRA